MNSTQKLLGDMFGGNRMMTGGDFKKTTLTRIIKKRGWNFKERRPRTNRSYVRNKIKMIKELKNKSESTIMDLNIKML